MRQLKLILQIFIMFFLIASNISAAGSMMWPVQGEITSDYDA